MPSRVSHSSSPHRGERWVGGKKRGCSLLRWQHCFSCPTLLRAHLQGWSPAAAERCWLTNTVLSSSSKWREPPRPGQEKQSWRKTDQQDRHNGGTEPHSQPKEHTSANFPQCQLYRPGCFTAVPRIARKPGLTLSCNRKDRAYE